MIEVQALSKAYGTEKAVDGLSFHIEKGEIVGFLGPNGAGKTTTMKMLTCYLAPSEGSARIDGLRIEKDSLAIRQKIGYLPESTPLYEDMNVYDYLAFMAAMRQIPKPEIPDRVAQYAEHCGLANVLGKPIQTLSKGYKQRVGLAQALLHDPDVLILDEPTSGLDPNQKGEILSLIQNLGAQKTVLLSTHILSEVEAICERVLILNKGKIVADGAIQSLRASFGGGQRIRLGLQQAELQAVEAVLAEKVGCQVLAHEAQDETLYLTVSAPGVEDLRPILFQLAIGQGWHLVELYRERVNLDDIFRQLTH